MTILKLHTHGMTGNMFFQFAREIHALISSLPLVVLKLAARYTAFVSAFEQADGALKKIVKSAITEKLQESDAARDRAFMGMVEANRACLKHFDPAVEDAAKRLKILFDTYGNVAKLPLNEQTSAVYNLLQELSGAYAADAARVGIDAWSAELARRNDEFEALTKERFDETTARTTVAFKTARAELAEAYKGIRKRLEALVELEGAGDYEACIKSLNTIIDKYAKLLAAKTGRRGSGGQGTGEQGTDDDGDDVGGDDFGNDGGDDNGSGSGASPE